MTSAGLQALRDECTRTIEPARALAAETLTRGRRKGALTAEALALERKHKAKG